MASTSKAFRRCADPCPRFLTPDDTHDLCVFCLGEEHARDVLEGAACVHCEYFSMKKLRSRLSLFSRGEGQPLALRGSGPSAAEARRKMSSWGSQADLADELKKGLSLSRSSAEGEDELLADDDAISLTSSDPAASALLGPTQEEEEMSEPSGTSCPAYDELVEVMDRATARLDLPWKRTRKSAPRGRLDERYLSDHSLPAQVSLPFLPDLHTEIEKVWKRPHSSRLHLFPHSNYANIEGMREHSYERMPPVEETLPSLPSVPLQITSRLNGRAYAAAGQAVGALHTMAVLQAYQADLLKDLDKGQGLSPDEVAELRRTTDLALRATKQAATAMGRSMGAMVVTERHLWVNLADLGKKERGFLLDAPVSPSELFGASVETVVEKFRESRARSAAFKTFIPRRSRSEPEQQGGPGPSRSEERRQAQKTSVATHAPPPPAGGSRRRRGSRGGKQDLREVIQTRQRSRLDQSGIFLRISYWTNFAREPRMGEVLVDSHHDGLGEMVLWKSKPGPGVIRGNHGGESSSSPPLWSSTMVMVCLPGSASRHLDCGTLGPPNSTTYRAMFLSPGSLWIDAWTRGHLAETLYPRPAPGGSSLPEWFLRKLSGHSEKPWLHFGPCSQGSAGLDGAGPMLSIKVSDRGGSPSYLAWSLPGPPLRSSHPPGVEASPDTRPFSSRMCQYCGSNSRQIAVLTICVARELVASTGFRAQCSDLFPGPCSVTMLPFGGRTDSGTYCLFGAVAPLSTEGLL
ncbi:Lamina-associated polypeptide 2, isoform alpha [Labeo rohita]|uniref:Lamina-associated polypeptide 2, isoform alpha n=1 Tax=Labeo rohita TaxID=84645 RepID=A0ABQ8L6G0_LABRO|nr:Lamina-associated polypeptide 2, isoform alpha [Labeo rohita]